MIKWLLILIGIVLISLILIALWVTRVENTQFAKNQSRIGLGKADTAMPDQQNLNSDTQTAVIVFSRSGNTGALAQHIADKTNADIYEIFAKDYELGIPGWLSALADARSNIASITPKQIELGRYDTVYLGSPIWLYSPAPPIWQFAKDNNFTGKDVVLFNTFNSKFEQHFIDDFENLVKANGAKSFNHRFVKRGRMGDQLSTEEMLKVFDTQNK
ncbi:flavodoxin family protein [Catenovulum sp. SX2]|uniref:flavodoxin family protein n=1 Tax=Catenovulum sp. SX2 TaxID=3398614 RepID=UPI003F837F57